MVYITGLTAPEPYHSAIIKIAQAKVSMPWITVQIGVDTAYKKCASYYVAQCRGNEIGRYHLQRCHFGSFEHAGNNALLMPAWMLRRCSLKDVIVNWTLVYLGNFAGAMLFVYFMVYITGLPSVAGMRLAVTICNGVTSAPSSMPQHRLYRATSPYRL